MKEKIKILGIAPYEGMQSLMQQLAQKRSNIDLTVYVGDLNEGASIASKHTLQDFDVILSRGGTAELISSLSPIPVVEVQLSVYDILRAIKLAENYTDRYAIVGFPAITKNAQLLCDVLQYKIDIYTVHNVEEVQSTLQKLISEQCRLVLCDAVTNTHALSLGMQVILFTSGAESIESAFDQAVKTAETYQALVSKTEFFRTLLEDYLYHIFVYDEQGEMVYSSRNYLFSSAIMTAMKNYVPDILSKGDKKFYRDEGGLLVAVRGLKKVIHKQTYVAYYVNTRKVPLSLMKNGIRYFDREQAQQAMNPLYSSFFGIANPENPVQNELRKISQANDPVMILGEEGIQADQFAGLVYMQSKYQNKPLAIINCSQIRQNSWDFLVSHTNSPFSDTWTSIFIWKMELLTPEQSDQLLSIIQGLNLHKKNRMIFSCTLDKNGSIPESGKRIMNAISCLPLFIPPLRELKEGIPNLVSLAIMALNMQLATEVVGTEPEALQILQSYSWPQNYDQFFRVMKELVLTAEAPYLKASAVSRILLKEEPSPQNSISSNWPDLTKTMEEIQLEILCRVLSEESGNQSAAAKRLGISRSTLWRMLRKLP
ncbi:MAG TPA: PrpR N-terminal domain-containing protein [Candidatus Cottocaccamicrobium excrementipullorum]|nr:PrpR N-terminal domain-containing protein [Candidatus Cottocaccamicrobium excrementipullorum]